jgi:HSP20 family protein
MLSYWDPFADMSRVQDRFFNRSALDRDNPWKPAVDIYEDEQGIHVKADLAGVKPEDIKVNVENNVLTISGERKFQQQDKREGYHRLERFHGTFSRSFALTDEINSEEIDARHENGVLTLTMHKRPTTKNRQIAIKGV